ncbi:uncharacterized protein LOC143932992 [Lithobates pipiens]
MNHIGLYAEQRLCFISKVTSQGTDEPKDEKICVMLHGSTTIAAASTVSGIRHSRDAVLGRALALNYIYTMNSIGDLWAEERLCNFYEVTLQGTDKPTDGKIYVMYHGTTSSIAESIIKNEFRQSEDGMLGRGVYVSRDISKALRYPLFNKADQVVLKLRVNVGKVIKIACKHHPLKKTWHKYGYDTAWVPPNCGMINSGLEEDCVWDPQRIKVVGIAHATNMYVEQYLHRLIEQYADSETSGKYAYARFFNRQPCSKGRSSCSEEQSCHKVISTPNSSPEPGLQTPEGRLLRKVAMAYVYGYNTKDLWAEERLPYFDEIILQGTDQPTDGKIYVMYHGTTSYMAESIIKTGFRQSADGMLGRGVYVSRAIVKAKRYPIEDKSDQVVLKLRVNVGKVIKIDRQYHPKQKTWHEHGYDTAWVPPYCGMVKSDLEEDCVWDPKRIKVVGIAHAHATHVQQYLQSLVQQYAI